MGDVISNAGLQAVLTAEPKQDATPASPNPRREAIRLVRSTLRNQGATDDEVDDALEALLELAKD